MPRRRLTRDKMTTNKWRIHGCGWLSREPTCRKYGAPRVHICTPCGSLIIGARSQMWFPWKVRNQWAEGGRSNYSDHIWSPIVWHPNRK